jgi:hypothetical protein
LSVFLSQVCLKLLASERTTDFKSRRSHLT